MNHGPNKRAHQRYDVRLPILLQRENGETTELESINVSVGGLFLEMKDPPPQNELLRFSLRLGDTPDARTIHLHGHVVHFGALGVGIRFDTVDDFAHELLQLEAFLGLLDDD